MTAKVDVIADWSDGRQVMVRIQIQTNVGLPVPKVVPAKEKPAGGGVHVEEDFFTRAPDVVYPIDEAVLQTQLRAVRETALESPSPSRVSRRSGVDT